LAQWWDRQLEGSLDCLLAFESDEGKKGKKWKMDSVKKGLEWVISLEKVLEGRS